MHGLKGMLVDSPKRQQRREKQWCRGRGWKRSSALGWLRACVRASASSAMQYAAIRTTRKKERRKGGAGGGSKKREKRIKQI